MSTTTNVKVDGDTFEVSFDVALADITGPEDETIARRLFARVRLLDAEQDAERRVALDLPYEPGISPAEFKARYLASNRTDG